MLNLFYLAGFISGYFFAVMLLKNSCYRWNLNNFKYNLHRLLLNKIIVLFANFMGVCFSFDYLVIEPEVLRVLCSNLHENEKAVKWKRIHSVKKHHAKGRSLSLTSQFLS